LRASKELTVHCTSVWRKVVVKVIQPREPPRACECTGTFEPICITMCGADVTYKVQYLND
jgi:hypothetical protein